LQAGRTRIALGWYKAEDRQWVPHGDIKISTVSELADSIDSPTLLTGELNAEERQRLMRKKVNIHLAPPSLCVRRPAVLAQLAWTRWQSGKLDEAASLAPIYLHTVESIPV
jgi:tRNA threonylcarbamoyladenosine biosynthesis protein TsaB